MLLPVGQFVGGCDDHIGGILVIDAVFGLLKDLLCAADLIDRYKDAPLVGLVEGIDQNLYLPGGVTCPGV